MSDSIVGIREFPQEPSGVAPSARPSRQYQLNFECRVCLKPTAICGPKGERLWCEAHCPDHQWSHRPEIQEWRCDKCEARKEDDYA